MPKTAIHRDALKVSLAGAALCAFALMQPAHAAIANPSDLCANMLKEIQSLVREIRTDCTVKTRSDGPEIAFNTEYRAFADDHQARSYLLYVFGSAGRMLNRSPRLSVSTVTLTDDALKRQGMSFSISALELKKLQNAASRGMLSMGDFHAELIRTGKFDRP